MAGNRLTRDELSWLLTQEARGAAQKLRAGVNVLPPRSAAEPTMLEGDVAVVDSERSGVAITLDRLDDVVSRLASLHGQPSVVRGRRGKVDLAALLWEIAPEARVQIEMGEGTTVFGDETELRRMLLVLIGQSGDPANARSTQEVAVRRVGDLVQVSVNLGPDKSATFETERAWLSRMAVRYGGQLTLDGSTQSLTIPADVDLQRRELESLKQKLAVAEAQGEAYARALAARDNTPPPSAVSASTPPPPSDGLGLLVAAARALGPVLRGVMAAIGRDIAPLRDDEGEAGEIAASVARHATAAAEVVGDLAQLGSCPLSELFSFADVVELLRDVVEEKAVRAARHDVHVAVESPPSVGAVVARGATSVLLHALLDHAIEACPAGSEVAVSVTEGESAVTITFDDAGPQVPTRARSGVLSREFEVLAPGRPAGLALIAAHALAAHVRAKITIEDGPQGGARIRLSMSKTGADVVGVS